MKSLFLWFALLMGLPGGPTLLAEDILREQTIELKRGWNAVHLEVHPSDRKPDEVFKDLPVDIAARYFRLIRPVQFITDPSEEPWKQEGWGIWYAPEREDAFLSSLHAIQGNQAYLVHATSDFQWTIKGKVRYQKHRWRHDSYNLVGATVDPAAPPTFAAYFAGASGKIGQKIYRLQNNKWVKVLNPSSTLMKSGEAFWTYCEGKTDYAGPLDLTLSASGQADFGKQTAQLEIRWQASGQGHVTVESVKPAGGETEPVPLPLHRVRRNLDTLTSSYSRLGHDSLAAPGTPRTGKFTIQVRREEMQARVQGALLKFSDGAGTVAWIPVTAAKAE